MRYLFAPSYSRAEAWGAMLFIGIAFSLGWPAWVLIPINGAWLIFCAAIEKVRQRWEERLKV